MVSGIPGATQVEPMPHPSANVYITKFRTDRDQLRRRTHTEGRGPAIINWIDLILSQCRDHHRRLDEAGVDQFVVELLEQLDKIPVKFRVRVEIVPIRTIKENIGQIAETDESLELESLYK
jgi:hypothetical protein